MSLKAFHIVFIAASIGLAFGFGVWSLKTYASEGGQGSLIMSIASFVAGLALIVYGWIVLKKLKKISLL